MPEPSVTRNDPVTSRVHAPDEPSSETNGPSAGRPPTAESVFAVAVRHVGQMRERELAVIAHAGRLLAERLLAGGTVWVFGTGHSRAVAMELAGRAGGLAGMAELVFEDLVLSGWAKKQELVDGELERRPEAATALLDGVAVGPADAFVVISHSGCNGAPVEMALQATRRGLPVVAITSLEHSRTVRSRHPSGLRLFEVAAISIDTGAPYADTAISLRPGLGVCGVSSFAGVLVAQALTAEIVGCYLEAGVAPPVLVSRNLPT
jgi:uncharacterized phosphosugar-binding protein